MSAIFPQFVWRISPYRENRVWPEVWYYESSSGVAGDGGKPISQATAARHVLPKQHQGLSLADLAKLYPAPEGWLWRQAA